MDRLTQVGRQMDELEKERQYLMAGGNFEVPEAQADQMKIGTVGGTETREDSQRHRIHRLFTYHSPRPDQLPKFAAINQAFENAALVTLANVIGPDRERVIEGLSQLRMIANRGIATDGNL